MFLLKSKYWLLHFLKYVALSKLLSRAAFSNTIFNRQYNLVSLIAKPFPQMILFPYRQDLKIAYSHLKNFLSILAMALLNSFGRENTPNKS